MRYSLRLLAQVERSTRFLEAGAPTGLAGLLTHSAPRSTLLYLYNDTLEKLKQFPESSVYRQSTEALTKHRLRILEEVKPEGLEEWQSRIQSAIDAFPNAFRKVPTSIADKSFNIIWRPHATEGSASADYDEEYSGVSHLEGPKYEDDKQNLGTAMARDMRAEGEKIPRIEAEPSLTGEQIGEIELKIGAGLIEEVIQVAEGEAKLVETLLEAKVWEDLEEKPTEGQWAYYQRDTHTGTTQAR
ncbi:hypothetical protein B0A48_09229 [Cryoendolithus antarcticus]|uniref:NADH-ubiquinone oxidoreductase 29.9 kDa subunit, mitochondrial n=1 Tax=Cryoendolithus antarcticus TaxID=1507870 RepID=A0A1V8T2A5_9PEZI|nr:hypothetical protein B0A48_09229 [Cryoendolithus antarcticus]OQO15806.1 hypothetical protein B0A51_16378 [Rachicladosporium sp. CCFEE 5018]